MNYYSSYLFINGIDNKLVDKLKKNKIISNNPENFNVYSIIKDDIKITDLIDQYNPNNKFLVSYLYWLYFYEPVTYNTIYFTNDVLMLHPFSKSLLEESKKNINLKIKPIDFKKQEFIDSFLLNNDLFCADGFKLINIKNMELSVETDKTFWFINVKFIYNLKTNKVYCTKIWNGYEKSLKQIILNTFYKIIYKIISESPYKFIDQYARL